MSTLTHTWTEEKIRSIIRKLDEKTGLNGASLPIKLASHGNALGYYQYVGEKMFGFKPKFINDPNTKEAEVIDLIRHEYAHYYVDKTSLSRYFTRKGSSRGHNTDWKWACKMVGADPTSYHRKELFEDKNWDAAEAEKYYLAEDIPAVDIQRHLALWGQIPMDEEQAAKIIARLKARNPDAYCSKRDWILHPKRGFGVVQDAIPYDYCEQKVYVRFEDRSAGVFNTKDLYRLVDGKAVSCAKRR